MGSQERSAAYLNSITSLKGNSSYDIFKSFAAFIIFMHRTTQLNPQNLLNPST